MSDNNRPLILITNDDGIDAPGITFLADSVAHLGDVVIVAPAAPQSGKSSALTVNSPLRVNVVDESNPSRRVYTVDGTPVDCVKLAMYRLAGRTPTVVLSGINHGSNAGVNLIYSGTMGAVMEGCSYGIPSVGYSLLSHSMSADFTECRPIIAAITAAVIEKGLPADVCLNVNFPAKVKIQGVKVVRGARSHWTEEYAEYTDPHGKPFYWLTGRLVDLEEGNPATDLYWLGRDYATVVPVRPEQSSPADIDAVTTILNP